MRPADSGYTAAEGFLSGKGATVSSASSLDEGVSMFAAVDSLMTVGNFQVVVGSVHAVCSEGMA